jgi:uncharacterized protein (DUF1501 family)
MKRREFAGLLALTAGSLVVPLSRSAFAAVSEQPSGPPRRLVVVFMRGAVDGLSVVVPYSDRNYYSARSSIAIAKPGQDGGALDLDGRFGLNPALSMMMPLWQSQRLAFVAAAGSPDTTRSHFDAQDYMESGTPGRKGTPDGWMNRLLGVTPLEPSETPSPMRAVAIGPTLPRIYAGSISVSNLPNGAAAGRPTLLDRPAIGGAFAQMYQGDDKLSHAFQDAQSSHKEIMASLDGSSNIDKEMAAADNGAPLPNGFPGDAARLAALMRNDPRVQLGFMAVGGWDTHANQGNAKGQLATRLGQLGEGLMALCQGLGPTLNDTTIVVVSEFGRTVRQNGNGGTDHGHGNVMWVMGGPVAGGRVYGQWPGLEDNHLYEGRDVAVTTDFRTVLSEVAERGLLLPDDKLNAVFPGAPGANRLKVMRA